MLTNLLIGAAIGLAVGLSLYLPGPGRWLRLRAWYVMTRSELRRGRTVLGLRVVEGAHAGLGPRWRVGSAVVAPGVLEFTRFVGGTSLVKRQVPAVAVVSLGTVGPIKGYGRFRLDPACEVARLTTPAAVLEMAVLPPTPAEQVLARMR